MSNAGIFPQSQKKTLLVSSCDWVAVEASVVPFNSATQRVNALERRPRNVRVCWHLSLMAVERRCQGEAISHRHGPVAMMQVYLTRYPDSYTAACLRRLLFLPTETVIIIPSLRI